MMNDFDDLEVMPMVFDCAWFDRHQAVMLWLLNHWLTRRWSRWVLCIRPCDVGYNRKILRLAPSHYVVFSGIDRAGRVRLAAEFRTHAKYAKRLYYAFRPLWWALHVIDSLCFDWWAPEFGFGFATLTAFPDTGNPGATTVDGHAFRSNVNQTWAALIAGAGTGVAGGTDTTNNFTEFRASTTTDQFSKLARSFFHFDTSALGDSDTINSATFSVKGTIKADNLSVTPDANVYASTVTSDTTLAASDYAQVGSTPFCDTPVTYANWSTAGYNDFALNASGLAAISKTGVTKFAGRNANYEVAASAPTWTSNVDSYLHCNFADVTGTSNDPKLVVDYSAGAVATPGAGAGTLTGQTPTAQRNQWARPVSDVSDGSWTAQSGSDLSAMIDEGAVPNDADYIRSSAAPVNDTAIVNLTPIQTPEAGPVIIRIRTRKL